MGQLLIGLGKRLSDQRLLAEGCENVRDWETGHLRRPPNRGRRGALAVFFGCFDQDQQISWNLHLQNVAQLVGPTEVNFDFLRQIGEETTLA